MSAKEELVIVQIRKELSLLGEKDLKKEIIPAIRGSTPQEKVAFLDKLLKKVSKGKVDGWTNILFDIPALEEVSFYRLHICYILIFGSFTKE